MVAAAVPYIGENTQKMQEVELAEGDKRILEITSTQNVSNK
jgi:hypothetical protein